MASPANRHCANCIGTLSFPILQSMTSDQRDVTRSRQKHLLLLLLLTMTMQPSVAVTTARLGSSI